MARRIRSIKPELLEDERTAGLSDTAFRLYIGCILMSDDYGNFRAAIKFIESQVYWMAIPERAVDVALQEIVDTEMVALYTVRGQLYGTFTNWDKHQRVDNKGKPMVPGPDEADSETSPRVAANRRELPRLAAHARPHDPAAGREGIGLEGIGNGVGLDPPARTHTREQEIPPPPDESGPIGEQRSSGTQRIATAVEQNRPAKASGAGVRPERAIEAVASSEGCPGAASGYAAEGEQNVHAKHGRVLAEDQANREGLLGVGGPQKQQGLRDSREQARSPESLEARAREGDPGGHVRASQVRQPAMRQPEPSVPGNAPGQHEGLRSQGPNRVEGEPTENGYDLAKRVWDELWGKKYKGKYQYPIDTGPDSDDRVLQDLGKLAIDDHGAGAEALLRHRMTRYLQDKGAKCWLETNGHPLRTIRKSWNGYGFPPKQREPSNVRKHPSSPPAAPVGMNRMADLAAIVAGIGKAGNA